MNPEKFDVPEADVAWCPGCGNFAILKTLKQTLAELEIDPMNLVLVSGIGQAAKIPHYLKTNLFNGLHGRALPPATAIKAANPGLTVIAESGDGDMYGEGGNHFIHTIRRNPDITNIVHNNMVYGLTKGQASPTSQLGFKTPVQADGVFLEPFQPLPVAIAMNASFVARAFAGDREQTKQILKKAIQHKGYALVDIFQPCVTFNKTNTFKYFKDKCYYIDNSHHPADRIAALKLAFETDKLPLGVFYTSPDKPTFEQNTPAFKEDKTPLYRHHPDKNILKNLINSLRHN